MKFGQVEQPELIDFSLPADHPSTEVVLQQTKTGVAPNIYVGCAKWNKADLKNFYPRGTKDELQYYATQFNSIELNATFYRIFPQDVVEKWYDKTPEGFKFFPKITQDVSHRRRLNEDAYSYLDLYLNTIVHLKEKLGTIFLQMHNNFGPKNWDRVVQFVERWPKEFPLAIEFRHTDWFNDAKVADELYHLLEENKITNVLVDTAGRRDMLHMRLTTNELFLRYVGANHESDYDRLDVWVDKLVDWKAQGLEYIHFFIHQNLELASPLLSAYFIKNLNNKLGTNLIIPKTLHDSNATLF